MASSKTKRLKYPGAVALGRDCRQSAGPVRDYAALNFKELLSACPLEGIELARERDLPRDVDF